MQRKATEDERVASRRKAEGKEKHTESVVQTRVNEHPGKRKRKPNRKDGPGADPKATHQRIDPVTLGYVVDLMGTEHRVWSNPTHPPPRFCPGAVIVPLQDLQRLPV